MRDLLIDAVVAYHVAMFVGWMLRTVQRFFIANYEPPTGTRVTQLIFPETRLFR